MAITRTLKIKNRDIQLIIFYVPIVVVGANGTAVTVPAAQRLAGTVTGVQ
jgi:hypothetical protein